MENEVKSERDWSRWLPPRALPNSQPREPFRKGAIVAWSYEVGGRVHAEVVRMTDDVGGGDILVANPGRKSLRTTGLNTYGGAILVADVGCEPTPPETLYGAPSSPPNTGEAASPTVAVGQRWRWFGHEGEDLGICTVVKVDGDIVRLSDGCDSLSCFAERKPGEYGYEYVDVGSPATPTGPASDEGRRCDTCNGVHGEPACPPGWGRSALKPAPVVAPLPACIVCGESAAHAGVMLCETDIFAAMTEQDEARRKPTLVEQPRHFHQSHQLLAGGVISLRDERGGR